MLNSEGCLVGESGMADEDYFLFNLAVRIVESESFVMPVIDVVLDNNDFVSVHVSVVCSQINLR